MSNSKRRQKFIDAENQRYGLFMDENSFDLEIEYGRNYLAQDVNYFIILHRVDVIESQVDDFYGEAEPSETKYMPAIKLDVMMDIGDSEQSYYGGNEGGITRDDTGNMIFGVYLKELKEKGVDISRGDIIEYNMSTEDSRFYEVENANNVTDTTDRTIAGFKPFYKEITAIPIKEDVVQYLKY